MIGGAVLMLGAQETVAQTTDEARYVGIHNSAFILRIATLCPEYPLQEGL